MNKKKYLKGFSRFSIFPIIKNSLTEYLVGEKTSIPYAEKLSKDLESEEETMYADDEIYDVDVSVTGEKFNLTLKELPNKLRAMIEGGNYSETTKEYDFSTVDNAPEFACTYRGLVSDGTYRMFRQYRAKVSKVKVDLETLGNGNKGSVEIEGMFMARACDNKLFTIKDTETGNTDLTWLDTIPSVPETAEEDLSKMTKEQLLAKATELGITTVTNSNNKDEIIAAIQAKLAE